jgi:hypothetical protein
MALNIRVEGTFTEKPRLYISEQEVDYEALNIYYEPPRSYSYVNDYNETISKTEPELVFLSFSLKTKVGQLEANVHYRVKANSETGLVLAEEKEKCGCSDKKTCEKHEKEETEEAKK